MSTYLQAISYFFQLPFHIQWRTFLVQLPRFVPLSILHLTSPKGPHPFVIALPSRKNNAIPIYVFIPPRPESTGDDGGGEMRVGSNEFKVPVVLDFHGGGFIMGSPLEQAPYGAMMSRELGAVVISVSYRIGPFHQFPAAIHDGEDVLSAILDTEGASKAGRVLRAEIQRYYSMCQKSDRGNRGTRPSTSNSNTTIVLDPSRLCISGFSAGGNIALNMALNVPPCAGILNTTTARPAQIGSPASAPEPTPTEVFSPLLLPPRRAETMLDDPSQSWPSLLPPPQAQPRMLPLLLFYPSLDARLLPHERPMKPLPHALNPDDRKKQKPKVPGLFSIMGPTYLPKRLRAHPRASPGLVDPSNIQQNATILLVLPEKDSLAVQSDVWVDVLNSRGWNGPVRFGDGREGDWDGVHHEGGSGPSQEEHEGTNGGLEAWHAPDCRHGWTQFPVTILGQHEKRERELVFDRTLDFVKEGWARSLPIERLGSTNMEFQRLWIPPSNENAIPASV